MRTTAGFLLLCAIGCGAPSNPNGSGGGDGGDGDMCVPGGRTCDGENVVSCDTGQVLETCAEACADGECVGACSPEALARSYTGCVYYAVDLPQWGQPQNLGPIAIGTIAATQQFAVAVANPWDAPVECVVEQNEALPGSPAQIAEVTRVTIAPESLQVIPLPMREVNGYIEGVQQSRSTVSANAYRITTSRPTSAYQFNPQNNPDAYSNDASLLIPVNALDENYVALGWPGIGGLHDDLANIRGDNRSYLTIVSARAGNRVRVVPATYVMGGDGVTATVPGTEMVFTLGEFETLTLEGDDFDLYGQTDFTGTRIESDGPLAVWSGVECVNINPPVGGGCCCDHLEEQLYPRSSLSGEYVAVRSASRDTGGPMPASDWWRVMALSDATSVLTSLPPPDDQFQLNRGEQRQMYVPGDFTVNASAPVMIGQFLVSQEATEAYTGDPAFILHPPVSQHRLKYIVLVPSGYGENWLQMSVPSGVEPTIDGAALSGCTSDPVGELGGVAYEAMRCPVDEGSHTLEAAMPFGLVIAGWGPGPVSYGYTGGMDFQVVNEECSDDSDCGGSEFCSGGECVDIID